MKKKRNSSLYTFSVTLISLSAVLLTLAAAPARKQIEQKPAAPAAWRAGVRADFAGLVDIGLGRKIYLECRGTGSPTVVLISGTRGAHDDWTDLIDPKNRGGPTKFSESAVFPQVSNFTRVCAYDRPGTSRNDNTVTDSTPVRQPTTAQQGVADLHALLIAAQEPGPYVLVGHSWGGLIARLFASMYPDEVAGLVLVDSASEFLKSSLTPAQWARYIQATKKLIESNGLEAPDHASTLGLLHGSPRVAGIPVVVLTSDKRFDFGAGGPETWQAWRTAQDDLAKLLNAKHVSETDSGHAIQMEQPRLVIDAIRGVVDAVRKTDRTGALPGWSRQPTTAYVTRQSAPHAKQFLSNTRRSAPAGVTASSLARPSLGEWLRNHKL